MLILRPILQPSVNAAATLIQRNEQGTNCLALEKTTREFSRLAKSKVFCDERGEEIVKLAKALSSGLLFEPEDYDTIEGVPSAQEFFEYFGVDEENMADVSNQLQLAEHNKSDLERAQDLMYQAWTESGARRVDLAREALEISKDCADAYVLLAQETAQTLDEARVLLETAVEAGERFIARRYSEDHVHDVWSVDETRPYLRAKTTLAGTLWALGEKDRAIELLQNVIVHEPEDWHGVRFQLVNWLLSEGLNSEVELLLSRYRSAEEAAWTFSRALLLFRQNRQPGADRALRRALVANVHVCSFLLGEEPLPSKMPATVEPGGESEAIEYAVLAQDCWKQTEGALEWLYQFDKDIRTATNLPSAQTWLDAIEDADRHEEEEKFPKAYGKLKFALRLAEKIGDEEFLRDTLYRLCDVCLELEAEPDDEQYFHDFVSLVDTEQGDQHPAYPAALQRLGEFLANLKKWTEAELVLEQCVKVMEHDPDFKELLNETLAVLCEVYRELGKNDQADECERHQDHLQSELEAEHKLWGPEEEE